MIRAATAGGPSMAGLLAGFFTSEVTIVRATALANEYGEPINTWAVVPDLIGLPALVAGGDVSIRMKRQEMRTSQQVYEMEYRRVLLNGSYDDIQHEDRAQFADRDWAIVSITQDVTSTFTELLCESLEPGNV